MYKLFYADGSAAMGVRCLLEEIGVDYELIPTNIDYKAPRADDLLALNPNGWVPVLIWDDQSMYECGAITVFLCDRHAEAGLAPAADDPARSAYLQWLFYFSSSLQNAFQMSYYPDRFADDPDGETSAQRRANRRLREVWRVVDDAMAGQDWIAGQRFTAADIYIFMLATWLRPDLGHPQASDFPNLHKIVMRLQEWPSIQKVYGSVFQ